jgi:hypothetical protein
LERITVQLQQELSEAFGSGRHHGRHLLFEEGDRLLRKGTEGPKGPKRLGCVRGSQVIPAGGEFLRREGAPQRDLGGAKAPQQDGRVAAGRGEQLSLGRKGDRPNSRSMSLKAKAFAPGRHLPEANEMITTRRGEHPAVGREGHRVRPVMRMSREVMKFLPRSVVEEMYPIVRHRQELTVGAACSGIPELHLNSPEKMLVGNVVDV